MAHSPRPERFPLRTISEIEALPQPGWLIEGYLPTGALGVLWGPPEAGKSFLALDWMCSVALGRPWHRRAAQRGRVVYICAENWLHTPARVRDWARNAGADAPDSPAFLICEQPLVPSLRGDPEDFLAALATHAAGAVAPALLVFDTLALCFLGDENETGDMNRWFAGLKRLHSNWPLCTILLIHHTGKDTRRGERGSNVTRTHVDCSFEIEVDEGYNKRWLRCRKMKNADKPEPIELALRRVPGGGTTVVAIDAPLSERIAGVLAQAADWMTLWQVRRRMNNFGDRDTIEQALVDLEGEGRAKRGGTKLRPVWRATERPQTEQNSTTSDT